MSDTLTVTELEVAKALGLGLSCAEIAVAQGRARKTVETHRGNILRKLGLANAVQLAWHGLREGWYAYEPLQARASREAPTQSVACCAYALGSDGAHPCSECRAAGGDR